MSDDTADAGNLNQIAPVGLTATRFHPLVGYAAGLGLVALATGAAFLVEHIVPSPNLALVFVLPVLLTAIGFGWGPALAAAFASVAAFDFFFIEPRLSLRVASATDLWAMSLLLVVAAIASSVAAQSRRRALDAEAAARRAEALRGLAHRLVEAAPPGAVCEAAGEALARIFQAPAVVLLERGDTLETGALAHGAALSSSDREAARWALANHLPTRGENFPFDTAHFDFWPIRRGAGPGIVLGVELTKGRDGGPPNPAHYVEMVGAYVAAGLSQVERTAGP